MYHKATYGAPVFPLRPTDSVSIWADIRSRRVVRCLTSPPPPGSAETTAGVCLTAGVGLQHKMHDDFHIQAINNVTQRPQCEKKVISVVVVE